MSTVPALTLPESTELARCESSSLDAKIEAACTHNAFIETVSVQRPDVSPVPGWAHTCSADWLMYYVPGDEVLYVLRPYEIRIQLAAWRSQYRTTRVPNKDREGRLDYYTHGLIVPLAELERIAHEVISL